MTQPPQGPPPEQQPEDPNKTTVFRPGEYDFTPPPPGQQQPGFGQHAAPPPPGYGQPGSQPYGQAQHGQPEYGQPQPGQAPYGQYGQQPYGQQQPPYGAPAGAQHAYATPYAGARTGRAFGVPGAALVVIGAILGVLAFTVLGWFRNKVGDVGSSSKSTFSKVHDALDNAQNQAKELHVSKYLHFGISPTYFSWLAWVLLAAAVVLGLLAVSSAGTGAVRGLAVLVGLAGAGLTIWALDLVEFDRGLPGEPSNLPGFTDYIKHSGFGAWAAVAAFLLITIGAAIGPRRA
jgi:hypothetical protein